jgi:hypothetical protein
MCPVTVHRPETKGPNEKWALPILSLSTINILKIQAIIALKFPTRGPKMFYKTNFYSVQIAQQAICLLPMQEFQG